MATHTAATPPRADSRSAAAAKAAPRFVLGMILIGVILFVPAGTLNWPMAWAFVGLHVVYMLGMMMVLMRVHPDLIAERSRLTTPDTKPWDKVMTALSGVFYLGSMIVAGLNFRFAWLPEIPLAVQIAALGVMLLGLLLFGWAMAVNRYFSRVVRIQTDRGHEVVTTGPYRIVRHPGYAGFIPYSLAMPIALGSLWALIPMLFATAYIVVRTVLEDRTLHEELPGYREFAQRTRYRLIPGIW